MATSLTLHTEGSVFLLGALLFVVGFFLFLPRALIKIHEKKCFQQQCLRRLPPPLSPIKSGSSNLKGEEKLSDTLSHSSEEMGTFQTELSAGAQALLYMDYFPAFLPGNGNIHIPDGALCSAVGIC